MMSTMGKIVVIIICHNRAALVTSKSLEFITKETRTEKSLTPQIWMSETKTLTPYFQDSKQDKLPEV